MTMSRSYLKGTLIVIPLILSLLYASFAPVSLAALSVDTDKDTYYLGDLVTVSVSGATANGHVNLQVNDPAGTPAYVDETIASPTGTATFKFKIPSTWSTGTYTVIVTDSSTGATATTTFKVETAPPPPPPPGVGRVIISADRTEVEVGGSVAFIVTVLDTNDKPMANQRVYLYINNELNTSKLTASTGKAIFKITFKTSGYYDVFAKSDTVKSSVITIYVYKPPPRVAHIDLTVNVTEIDAGGGVLLTATVYDQYGGLMADVRVELYLNDTYYAVGVTSDEGVATFTAVLDRAGTYEFYAMADEVKSSSVFVVVRPPPPPKPRVKIVDISVDKLEVLVGGSVKVSVRVLDQFNKPMANVLVRLYVNESLYALNRTNVNGRTFFKPIFDKPGTYVLRAEAEEVRSTDVFVFVSPVPAPPPPIMQYVIYIALILIVVVAVVLVLYYKRKEY